MAKPQSASKSQPKSRRQALAEAFDRYVKVTADHRATGGDAPEMTRRLQEAISEVCVAYVSAKAAGEDVTFPQNLAAELAFAFGDLATGHQVKLLRPQRGRGKPGASFSVEKAQRAAVRYVRAAKSGCIDDPHPVASVIQAFKISSAAWRRWQKKHSDVSTADVRVTGSVRQWVQIYLECHPDADLFWAIDALRFAKGKKIKDLMEFAAHHYQNLPGAR